MTVQGEGICSPLSLASDRQLRIVSLCDYTGTWSKPYRDAGYQVFQIDLHFGQDVRLLRYPDVPIHGVLAAPPCTHFARAGNAHQRTPQQIMDGLSIVDACLRFITIVRPKWWALENPSGRLLQYLGPPRLRFQPWHYGDAWCKLTCLWGDFAIPVQNPVPHGMHSERMRWYNGHTEHGRVMRAMTPPGFAQAFFTANP